MFPWKRFISCLQLLALGGLRYLRRPGDERSRGTDAIDIGR